MLGLSISVQVQEGIVVVLDYDVSFGAHFLGQHFVVLRKPFLQELEASGDLTTSSVGGAGMRGKKM